ncbi:hypothetical protein L7F22_052163 [Adiantum nelumboides]|nr:hypothetical protein [Adiantum nelumboides]
MVGYCLKNQDEPHFQKVKHNISADDVNNGIELHSLYGADALKNKVCLTPANVFDCTLTFWCFKLNHPIGNGFLDTLQKMITFGKYYPSSHWIIPYQGHGMLANKVDALRKCGKMAEEGQTTEADSIANQDMDCSSGACEQNLFAYSLLYIKIHNKLLTKQLERLSYCRSNLHMLRSMHKMPIARQVNVDECKLCVETFKSLNKDHDLEDLRELYMELEEIDRRVSCTRFRKKVVVRGLTTTSRGSFISAVCGGGKASAQAPTIYVHIGSGSGFFTTATMPEDVPLSRSTESREPEFDDEGNILSEGDYGFSFTHSDTCSDEEDTHGLSLDHEYGWETNTST